MTFKTRLTWKSLIIDIFRHRSTSAKDRRSACWNQRAMVIPLCRCVFYTSLLRILDQDSIDLSSTIMLPLNAYMQQYVLYNLRLTLGSYLGQLLSHFMTMDLHNNCLFFLTDWSNGFLYWICFYTRKFIRKFTGKE